MDAMMDVLYKMTIMSSEAIEWISFNHWPDCRAWVDRQINGYYSLAYADRGQLSWAVNRGPLQTLAAPVAWWTWPDVWWNFGRQDGKSWDHRFVSFRGARADRWVQAGLLPIPHFQPHVTVRHPTLFRENMDRLFREIASPSRNWIRAENTLETLLLLLEEDRKAAMAQGIHEPAILALAEQVRQHPAHPYDWSAESRNIGLSLSHFRAIFRDILGLPPGQYHSLARMQHAAHLLRTTLRPIKEIAEEAGFPDIYHFNRLFKRHLGFPPGRYRRQARLSWA
jgi:AraC-like DNA-binding protein